MQGEFTGAPSSTRSRIERWMTPRGGPIVDGIRLAVINTAALTVSLALLSIASLLYRIVDNVTSLPFAVPGAVVGALLIAAALWAEWRYAAAHCAAARAASRTVQADLFGIVGALPFAGLGFMLLGSGLLGIFVATITFSSSRFVDALGRLGYSLLFFALAVAVVAIARHVAARE